MTEPTYTTKIERHYQIKSVKEIGRIRDGLPCLDGLGTPYIIFNVLDFHRADGHNDTQVMIVFNFLDSTFIDSKTGEVFEFDERAEYLVNLHLEIITLQAEQLQSLVPKILKCNQPTHSPK